MPKKANDPSLMQDIGALADLYLNLFWTMGERMRAGSSRAGFPDTLQLKEPGAVGRPVEPELIRGTPERVALRRDR